MKDQLFINGAYVPAASGEMFDVVDPSNNEVVHKVARAGASDIDAAVKAARAAFDTGPWRNLSGTERAAILRKMGDEIAARTDELARMEVLDNGKPLPEAVWDIEDTAGVFHFYADLAERLDNSAEEEITLGMDGFTSKAVKEPVGVAGAIIPWNFPMLMASWKVAPALAAGCTVVQKPSEVTPLTALEFGEIANNAGLPAGALNIVTGFGPEAGQPLTEHPDVDKLAFTGSVPTGSRIMATAAKDVKTISLELGGKSPLVVFADTPVEEAVEWIMFGIFWNQGEVCSASLRRFLCSEPRSAPAGSFCLLVPACDPAADVGMIILQPDQAHAMSGSNAMCAVTAMLETGMIPMVEPETVVTLDTAAGLVRATAACEDGKVTRVSLDMPPSFVAKKDAVIETDDWGSVRYDLCFGGVFYALVDVDQVGLTIAPENARDLATKGVALRNLIAVAEDAPHPTTPALNGLAYVMFRSDEPDGAIRTCTTLRPGRADRSPCGTGSNATMAVRYTEGTRRTPEDRAFMGRPRPCFRRWRRRGTQPRLAVRHRPAHQGRVGPEGTTCARHAASFRFQPKQGRDRRRNHPSHDGPQPGDHNAVRISSVCSSIPICILRHPRIKPDRKRSPLLQRKGILCPVPGLVLRRCPAAHSIQL